MELFKASAQWATRPSDERFASLAEMYQVTKGYADTAKTARVPYKDLRVEAVDGEVQVTGKAGVYARLTHWAFGQMARLVSAPADYLRALPATLAVQNLNHGLKEKEVAGDAALLFHQNGSLLLRAMNSEMYKRIWNWEIVERLQRLESSGWHVPPARPAMPDQPGSRVATEGDVLRLGDAGRFDSLRDAFNRKANSHEALLLVANQCIDATFSEAKNYQELLRMVVNLKRQARLAIAQAEARP